MAQFFNLENLFFKYLQIQNNNHDERVYHNEKIIDFF
jgi:hypothetical protein